MRAPAGCALVFALLCCLPGCGEDGGGDSSACAAPGAGGNSLGVGRYCTPGGMECSDTDGAFLCTVDVRPDAPPFCTRLCGDDSDCGEDAVCEGDDESEDLRGCTPACLLE